MTKPDRDQVAEICQPDGVVTGAKLKILPFARLCKRLYEHPSTSEWLHCLRCVLDGEHKVESWHVLRGDPSTSSRVSGPAPGTISLRSGAARRAPETHSRSAPEQGFMTIHRAKGLEF